MTEAHKEESQKTVISFIFGLLIGGLLVWAFMGGNGGGAGKTPETADTASSTSTLAASSSTPDTTTPTAGDTPALSVGSEGTVTITDKKAGKAVAIATATYPIAEGWIGVRSYEEGKLGWILGVVRFSQAGNIVPTNIHLQTPTVAGKEYAVVMFTEGGDRAFNSATDRQLDTIFTTFTAE